MSSLVGELLPHPDSNPGSVSRLRAGIGREIPTGLSVIFKLEGDMSSIRLGENSSSDRKDKLWQSTCFECFVRDAGGSVYREYNLSPRGQWAAYDFVAYREGMSNAEVIPPIRQVEESPNIFTLEASLSWRIPVEPRRLLTWCIALSAVIEEADGTKSYWALAHPPGKPDFHHPDCFTLELPPPNAP